MNWEKRSTKYDKTSWVNDNNLLSNFLNIVLSYPKNISILDAASGTGVCAKFLFKNGYKNITCVDSSADMLKHNDINVIKKVESIENITFLDKSFDIIICRNALHYINIDKTLSEFNRLIKNNGKILISQVIPPDDELSSEYDKLIGRNIHYPTNSEIIDYIKNYVNNVDNVNVTFSKHRLNIHKWLDNTLPTLDKKQIIINKYYNTSDKYKSIANLKINDDIFVDTVHAFYIY